MSETLKEASQNAKRYLSNEWVKWIHGGSKTAYTHEEKAANTIAGSIGKHCAICLNLNVCCFIMKKADTARTSELPLFL